MSGAAVTRGGGVDWSLIAAADRHGLIGIVDERGARLPWRLPDDLAWFKRTTMGRPLVMGRRTFESIGRALPGRLNVVLTRQGGVGAPGVVAVADAEAAAAAVSAALDEAARAAPEAARTPSREAFVIGGADVFAQFMPLARRLYLTEIDHVFDGNCRVAAFEPRRVRAAGWREVSREPRRSADGWDYAFAVYERAAGGGT